MYTTNFFDSIIYLKIRKDDKENLPPVLDFTRENKVDRLQLWILLLLFKNRSGNTVELHLRKIPGYFDWPAFSRFSFYQ